MIKVTFNKPVFNEEECLILFALTINPINFYFDTIMVDNCYFLVEDIQSIEHVKPTDL